MPAFFSQGISWVQRNAVGKAIKEKQSVVVQITFLLMVVLYMMFGSVMFMLIEGDLLNDRPPPVLDDNFGFTLKQQDCLNRVFDNKSMGLSAQADGLALCVYDDPAYFHDPWSDYASAVMFTFTIITTIAPVTPLGRVLCCVYGLFGIPLAMMTVANIGKCIMEVLTQLANRLQFFIDKWKRWYNKRHTRAVGSGLLATGASSLRSIASIRHDGTSVDDATNESNNNIEVDDEMQEPEADLDEELSNSTQSALVLCAFLVYIVLGSMLMQYYEPDMTVFNGIYFNFVTLTTVGLGDMVPKSHSMLWFTIVYVTVGLALTTMAIEIASEGLRKMHHYGRKMANPANAYVWFGGKRITVSTLMRNLGEMYDIDELKNGDNLDVLNDIIDVAIDKDENPDKYPKRADSSMSSDHYSVKPKHLSSMRNVTSALPFVDSEEETSHMDGLYGML